MKRAYEQLEDEDGRRHLIDQLWPRGLPKTSLKIDGWLKEVAPVQACDAGSTMAPKDGKDSGEDTLTNWMRTSKSWKPLIEAARKGSITLIYSARDTEHNNGVALAEYLRRQQSRIGRPG